jgi:hypothetical protein
MKATSLAQWSGAGSSMGSRSYSAAEEMENP